MRLGLRGVTSDSFVQELWFNQRPPRELWYEGVKLYPDERTVVRDIVIGEPADSHYWRHAVDAAERGSALLVMTLAGRRFHLGRGDGSLPVLRDVGGAWRATEDMQIKLTDCLDAVVTLSAAVPERSGGVFPEAVNEEKHEFVLYECGLPWLPGTRVRVRYSKGRKKRNFWAGNQFVVLGMPSKTVHAEGHCYVDDYWRGDVNELLPEVTRSVWENKVWDDVLVERDEWLYIGCAGRNQGNGTASVELVFPAFTRSWRVGVLGVTLQPKKD